MREAAASLCGGRAWVVLALALALLGAPSAAGAAQQEAVLDPVAPGVPGGGRAWELVTPGEVFPGQLNLPFGGSPLLAVSASGDRVAYRVVGSLGDAPYGAFATSNLAQRGETGWTSSPLSYPHPESTDSTRTAFGEEGPIAFDPTLSSSLWLNAVPGSESKVGLYASGPGGYSAIPGLEGGNFIDASADLERVLFRSPEHLVPADADRNGYSLYLATSSGVTLLDRKDDGSPISSCGISSYDSSDDARQAFFTANLDCQGSLDVYLYKGGHTVDISTSQCTLADCGPEQPAFYLGRSPSGSVAYLETIERLVDADTDDAADIYRYDVASGKLSLLYDPPEPWNLFAAFIRASDDGSRTYILNRAQLIPGQGSQFGNLYLVDDQGLHFVGASEDDRFQISRDGRFAVFVSTAQLGDGDNDEQADLYRYDANDGTVARLSAGVGGAGNGNFEVRSESRIFLAVPRAGLADVGRRAFFATAEALLPEDRNEKEDVYEWTEAGLRLISAGTPGLGANFLGSTPDGTTAFFLTNATLVRRDRDGGELDIYAARVGGGFPELPSDPGCAGCAAAAPGPEPRAPRPRSGKDRARIELAPIDAAARRQLVATGSTVLLAEVPGAGRLAARGRARTGARRATVASGSVAAKAQGSVRLRLRLTAAGRRALARGGPLTVRLRLRMAAQEAALATRFTLRRDR